MIKKILIVLAIMSLLITTVMAFDKNTELEVTSVKINGEEVKPIIVGNCIVYVSPRTEIPPGLDC